MNARKAIAALTVVLAYLGLAALPAAASAPVVTVADATNVTATSADVEGTVNAEGQSTSWTFQYATQADFSDAKNGPSGSTESSGTVSGQLTGLHPNTTYHLRLLAENAEGPSEAVAADTFTTSLAAPQIESFVAGPVSSDQADINGEVNPRNSATTYHFRWGTSDCSANPCTSTPALPVGIDELQEVEINATGGQFTLSFEGQTTEDISFPASSVEVASALEKLAAVGTGNVSAVTTGQLPNRIYSVSFVGALAATDVPEVTIADGTTPLENTEGAVSFTTRTKSQGATGDKFSYVTDHLTGLSPATTYHFQLIAVNTAGTTEGPDEEFTTAAAEPSPCPNELRREEQHSTYLPNCRAYEMVSPPEKEGGDVEGVSDNTHISEDGNAAVFSSQLAFGEPEGTGPAVQYLSERRPGSGGTGWVTHPISPREDAMTIKQNLESQQAGYEAAFTPELTYGIYRTASELFEAPNVAGFGNFYLRGNLRTGEESNVLLTNSSEPVPKAQINRPKLAGASRDLSHIIFESFNHLTPNAGFLNLYESVNGQVRLAGVLPNGEPAFVSTTGVSSVIGGSTPIHMISEDGSRIFFNDFFNGNIYMRENGTTTVKLNESEKSEPEEPQPAHIYLATPDGSRAFFITAEGLVNGDNDHQADVYMYDVTKPAGSRLTRLSATQVAGGAPGEALSIVGASDSGDYVYFIDAGQLLPSQPPAENSTYKLYVWHDGSLKYIGGHPNDPTFESVNSPTYNAFDSLQFAARVTPDGRHLLFMAMSNEGLAGRGGFAGYDQGESCTSPEHFNPLPCRELYLYSADSGRLQCVSCGAPGTVADSDARDATRVRHGALLPNYHLAHALADNGRFVFFDTGQSLVERDTNGKSDVYEFDSQTGNVYLISSGVDKSDSYFLEASNSGQDVLFMTRKQLLGWDQDASYDLYDARVNGGFAEPTPQPAPCQGESCRPRVEAPPPPGAAITESVKGAAPQRPCRKGTRRVQRQGVTKCVRKHHRGKKHHKNNGRKSR